MNLSASVNETQSHLNHCVSVCLCVQSFQPPKKPFRRMRYTEALVYLKENNITKDDGSFYEFGDVRQCAHRHTHANFSSSTLSPSLQDIPEMPERKMTDKINEPILLCCFPAEIKSFYMPRCQDDKRLTESVDLLMPGVGEIIGGSMRIWDYVSEGKGGEGRGEKGRGGEREEITCTDVRVNTYSSSHPPVQDELLAGYKREGISPEPYYWYTDQVGLARWGWHTLTRWV